MRRKTVEDYHKLAESRGFTWLGSEVSSGKIKTAWQCPKGHKWLGRYHDINRGIGCPVCSGNSRRSPENYHALAQERGFRWVGPQVTNNRTKTTWQCSLGHFWEGYYGSIQQGIGCPKCAAETASKRLRFSPDKYHELAQRYGFNWLGPEVPNSGTKTKWLCSKNHEWASTYDRISRGKGCPACYGNLRKTPEDYQNLAQERGFEWLGDLAPGANKKTPWRCKKCGHEWEAVYNNLKQGNGCPECGKVKQGLSRRKKPSDYHALAERRGFRWIGPEATVVTEKTTWQCSLGHFWEARYSDINRYGCPVCKESKGEERIARVLSSMKINFLRQKRFDSCKDKTYLSFDFYFQVGDKQFLVEYNGIQHYESVEFFGGIEKLSWTQRHDQIKTEFAKEHGYILIIIPYIKYNAISAILRQAVEAGIGKPIEEIIKPISKADSIGSQKPDLDLYTQASFWTTQST